MKEVQGKFLPAGSVVLLKGATKRLMITGFCAMDSEHRDVMYDYCGCLYPEGVISSDETVLFNHDQIAQIYHIGYSDAEEQTFKIKLNKLISANVTMPENMPKNVYTQEPVAAPTKPSLTGYTSPVNKVSNQQPTVSEPVIVQPQITNFPAE